MNQTTAVQHNENCIDYAFSLAVENHYDATGEDIYTLPFDYGLPGVRTYEQAVTELRIEAVYYLDGGLCECRDDCPLATR